MDNRLNDLTRWLVDSLSIEIESIEPASQDASFRRYFRVDCNSNPYGIDSSLIAMDAPPAEESLHEFIAIDQALVANKIHAPKIHAINQEQGFLLLEDLGNRTYLDELSLNPDELYNNAINCLVSIQNLGKTNDGSLPIVPVKLQKIDLHSISDYVPPIYDRKLIEQELDLFVKWYCQKHLQINLSRQQLSIWTDLKNSLVTLFDQQPHVWVHRDFHSRNLMITNHNSPGVIDFQDMVWGPISYDLASIFKDCYIEWPRERQLEWLTIYLDKWKSSNREAEITLHQLVKWFDLTGLQRHLKVLGIFCRLNYRDGKNHYLLDLPLVEKYIIEVLDLYPTLSAFKNLFASLNTHH